MELGLFEEPDAAVRVSRWPSEIPLLILVVLLSLALWVLLTVSIIGIFYAVLLGTFFFMSHVAFVAHVRGSAVRLTPDQFPELHRRVEELARRIGLRRLPDAYVMQAGGLLNALATRLMSANLVVLYSDLLEACGENTQARDMIIGHELGHLKAGHLRWRWFLMPGLAVPFLGHAYSRAREYTCDRYGAAVCDDRAAALRGLAILAAGAVYGPKTDLRALARQAEDLNTSWMTIGRWFATHPPLAQRIAAVEPSLATAVPRSRPMQVLGALAAVLLVASVPLVAVVLFSVYGASRLHFAGQPAAPTWSEVTSHRHLDFDAAKTTARSDLDRLAHAVETYKASHRRIPQNESELYQAWSSTYPGAAAPTDPFDGERYGYATSGQDYHLWSSGINLKDPRDDIFVVSREGVFR